MRLFGPEQNTRWAELGPPNVVAFQRNWDGTTPYAIATVVHTVGATAAKPGARAVVTVEGELIGFVGGGCVRRAILEAGSAAIAERKPRLIRAKPKDTINAEDPPAGGDVYASSCPSRGEMDVFIEPVLPRPPLINFGENELADGLLKLGEFVGLNPLAFQGDDTDVDPSRIVSAEDLTTYPGLSDGFIVVATQGRGDKAALQTALSSSCPHIFFVASRKKTAYWRDSLTHDGLSQDQLKRLNAPAGLAIGAQGPNEIAIAILGAIIQIRRVSPNPANGEGDTA